jgi:hypothetical protein
MTPHNSLIFLNASLGNEIIRRYVSETHRTEPLNGTLAPLPCRRHACPSSPPLKIGYLCWEVVETDVLYTLIAGLLEHHSSRGGTRVQGGPEVVVYTLTRRQPPRNLKTPGSGGVRFVSFSRTEGSHAAQVIRSDGVQILYDMTTYGDFSGAHVLRHLPAPVQVLSPSPCIFLSSPSFLWAESVRRFLHPDPIFFPALCGLHGRHQHTASTLWDHFWQSTA